MQIARDLRIPESDDAISFLLKPKLPFTIVLGGFVVIMMTAVEFDDEVGGWTQKIYNIGTDRRLTSEVCAAYQQFFQSAPQDSLVVRGARSQFLGRCSADRCRDHVHLTRG
jgi:hypothetical protein